MTLCELREQANLSAADVARITDTDEALIIQMTLDDEPLDPKQDVRRMMHHRIRLILRVMEYALPRPNVHIHTPDEWLPSEEDPPELRYDEFVKKYPDYPRWIEQYQHHKKTVSINPQFTDSMKDALESIKADAMAWYYNMAIRDANDKKEVYK